MRHHADRNRLHTRLFKSAPINRFAAVQGTPRRFSSWSIHLFATAACAYGIRSYIPCR
jgi:hypothetical protein